ncbi:MAG TPA: phasin family protein [Burkholderiaceae bacterium]|nr:phasin family protein [Burkholderiaceae bacterium]
MGTPFSFFATQENIMATNATREANGRRKAAAPAAVTSISAVEDMERAAPAVETAGADTSTSANVDSERDATFDGALDTWSTITAKEQLSWEIASTVSLLRNAEAVREAQHEVAKRAEAAHEQAAEQVKQARGIAELAAIQLELARVDTESAFDYWSRMGELSTRTALETINEAASGIARLQSATMDAFAACARLQSTLAQTPEVLEAEVEHVTNPFTSNPFLWPMQEAARQAMTMASSAWNDMLDWSGRWANASTDWPKGHMMPSH